MSTTVSQPIWHSPAWITAIVAFITTMLTIPNTVGDYLSKKQDIELAQAQVRLAEIENRDRETENRYKPVITVRQTKPEERGMLLRFIAATADSSNTREWAQRELEILSENQVLPSPSQR